MGALTLQPSEQSPSPIITMAGMRTMLKHILLAALAVVAVTSQPQQVQSSQDCRGASGGSTDVCRSSSQRFCCNKLGGGSQTYDDRVFQAGFNRYCSALAPPGFSTAAY